MRRKHLSPLNLFIIEDNVMYNFFLKYHVHEHYSFRVFDFVTFDACLENNNGINPDIILLDYELPHINGLQSIPLLKKMWPSAQIVIISSKVDDQTAAMLSHLNIVCCVAKKDCTVGELNKVIDSVMLRIAS